jgi:hypothetical protein
MNEKCSICGKRAILGNIFKCNICGGNFCHRHEKEQYIQSNVPGLDEIFNSYVYYNYPSGKSVNYETFKCYQCRTGIIPIDMGSKKIFLEDYLFIFVSSSIVVFGILIFFAVFGMSFGLSLETCKALESTSMYYVVTVLISSIIIFSIIGLYYRGLFRTKVIK